MCNVIGLRPATVDDKPFVDDLLFKTMHGYVEASWPKDPEAQRHYYEINKFNFANTRIIQVGGKDIGRLSTTIRTDCIFIDELHIVPEYQRQGIGKQAIEHVVDEARERQIPVKATILKVNHASQRLCLGMGFQVVDEKDHRFHIQYVPGAAGRADSRS